MSSDRARWWTRRYGPFVVIALAVILVLVIAPSRSPIANTGTSAFTPSARVSAAVAPPTGKVGPKPTLNCSRQALLGSTFPCEVSWKGGSNGGSTTRGVSAHSINLVYYLPALSTQLSSVAANAGVPSNPAVTINLVDTYNKWFASHFQTYGRTVHVIFEQGKGQVGDEAALRADAVTADLQYHAFAMLGPTDSNLIDEATHRGIFLLAPTQFPNSFYVEHAPYAFGIFASTDTTDELVAEYIANKLGRNSKAKFGGANSNPAVNGQTRRYGIIYPVTNQDGSPSIYAGTADDLQKRLARFGIPVAVKIGYSLDINQSQTQATNITAQFRAAHVTTEICLCDPVSPIFDTHANTAQGYYPEILVSGYQFTDVDQFGRLYDPAQMVHAFGVSTLPEPEDPASSAYYQVYRAVDPSSTPPTVGQLVFPQLEMIYLALELAGPNLTTKSFADAMFSERLASNAPQNPTFGFTPTDYGGIQDAREVWWDPKALGVDGIKGTYEAVDGGYGFLVGHWPMTPSEVFNPACVPLGSCGAPTYAKTG